MLVVGGHVTFLLGRFQPQSWFIFLEKGPSEI